jgi:TolA-binding protein
LFSFSVNFGFGQPGMTGFGTPQTFANPCNFEPEKAQEYNQIRNYGYQAVRLNSNIDEGEMQKYMLCAQVANDVAMLTVLKGGAGVLAAGAAAPATAATAPATAAGAAPATATAVTPAATSPQVTPTVINPVVTYFFH